MSPQLESIRTGVGAVRALVGSLAAVHVSLQFVKLHRCVVTVGTQLRFIMCIVYVCSTRDGLNRLLL